MLNKTIALGISTGYTTGILNKIEVVTGNNRQTVAYEKDEEKDNLYRLDVSAGLKWYF